MKRKCLLNFVEGVLHVVIPVQIPEFQVKGKVSCGLSLIIIVSPTEHCRFEFFHDKVNLITGISSFTSTN